MSGRAIFYFFILLGSIPSRAQFAIIQDKEGFTSCRTDRSSSSRVTDTLRNGHLIYITGSGAGWLEVMYQHKGEDKTAFIIKDRLKLVEDFTEIPMIQNAGPSTVRFRFSQIGIQVTKRPFDRSKHRLTYYKDSPKIIELIDGKPYWGRDGELPTWEFSMIVIRMGTVSRILPFSSVAQLYEPNLADMKAYYDQSNDTIYLTSANGDGAGYYEVAWKIVKGQYAGRFVASGF